MFTGFTASTQQQETNGTQAAAAPATLPVAGTPGTGPAVTSTGQVPGQIVANPQPTVAAPYAAANVSGLLPPPNTGWFSLSTGSLCDME